MKSMLKRKTAAVLVAALLSGQCMPAMVSMAAPSSGEDVVLLVNNSIAAPVLIDKASGDLAGITLNSEAFAGDIELVTGSKPQVCTVEVSENGVTGIPDQADTVIIAGTVNDSIIQYMKNNGKLDSSKLSEIENRYEQYNIQVIDEPMGHIKKAVVITGSDKRGTVYGLYHISQDLAGVSPWYYWGDVPVTKRSLLSFGRSELETTSQEPSVKYRGIFLNDEAPSLSSWVKKFGGYNQDFYDHVYELILRLKGNYLWPAMWSNNFSGDGTEMVDGVKDTLANARHADAWGVIMGTSHHEPMCRAGVEWGRIWKDYGQKKDWNFFTNGDAITRFWHEGAERNKDFENVITIGMRGEADSPLVDENGNPFTLAQQIEVLKHAIEAQKNSLNELGLENSPQMICLYKEVEEAWYGNSEVAGLKNWETLKDDIVMLCEDNHGNLRMLPTEEDKALHKGGWGMYYHFDYHGGPTSYEWVNTVPLEKIWNNMAMAYDYGVKDMWIVNVGDLKPMELPISYFMDMAYDFDAWGTSNSNSQDEYIAQWVEQQFGSSEFGSEAKADIVQILHDYPTMSAVRKPETIKADTFSAVNYNELQRKLAEAIDLEARAEKYWNEIQGSLYEDTYYQLVYYPAAATANVYKMQLFAGLNDLYYSYGSVAANTYASLLAECVQKDKDLQDYYNNTMAGGKWKGMMSSPHVGYVTWNSDGWSYPLEKFVTPADGAVMLVDVDGTKECRKEGTLALPEFTSTGQECYGLTISNGGNERVNYRVEADKPWINVAVGQESVSAARTLPVSIAWDKLEDSEEGSIIVTSDKGKVVTIKVKATRIVTEGMEEKTFTSADGVIVMNAENYSSSDEGWKKLEGFGRTGATMKVFPVTSFYEPGDGPKLHYNVNVTEDGNYNLTAYVGPSNPVYENARIRYAVQIDGGEITVKDSIDDSYVGGSGNSWGNSIKMAGRSVSTSHELEAGQHTITIYGVDAGLLLEKLVLSKENLKQSHTGPAETWYVGKPIEQQPLVHYQIEESMTLPGTIYAADGVNVEDSDVVNGVLKAEAGKTYVYPVTISGMGTYQFSVNGSSAVNAKATLKYGDTQVGSFALSPDSAMVTADEGFELKAGTGTITLEVMGEALINTVYVEKLNTEPGLPVTVIASSTAEDSSAEFVYDGKRSTVWKPDQTDQSPFIGLDFGERVSTDWFRLIGSFEDVTSYEIQTSQDGSNWSTVYEENGEPESGEKVYIQGTSACRGSQWRVRFYGGSESLKVSELEMSTYINWAIEDSETKVTVGAVDNNKYKQTSLIDGDRIAPSKESGAWIAGEVSGSKGNNYAEIEFGEIRKISGVNIVAMQDTVYQTAGKYDWKTPPQGAIPDEHLISSFVQNSYTLSYRDETGKWVKASTINTSEELNKKVLVSLLLDEEVKTDAVKVEVGTYYWVLLAEIEPVEMRRYTLDGIKEGWKNWALKDNGGNISVSSTYSQSSENLNDGIRVCGNDNSNRWRANEFPAWVEIQLPQSIDVDTVNLFGQQKADAAIEPTKELTNAYKYTPFVIQYWKDGQWVEGGKITENLLVWNQWKPEEPISTDKIRLYFENKVGDGFLRLSEIEVYGLLTAENPDDSLKNYALTSQGTEAVGTNDGNPQNVINGDLTGNEGRWRSNSVEKASSLTIKLDGKKEISSIDLLTQQPDSAKVNGVYVKPEQDTKTNLGIKKFNVYYNVATSSEADPDWKLIKEVNEDMTGAGTKVWNHLEFDESVTTDKFKFEFPAGSGKDGWIRVVEIMLWGQEPKDPDDEDKPYTLTVDGGIIDSINGKMVEKSEGKAGKDDRVIVTAEEEGKNTKFEKWEVKLAPDNFSLASSSNATVKFDMPAGDVALKAVYHDKTASPSNATAVSKAIPEGWAYGDQADLDALLEDTEIVTEKDQAVLDAEGEVLVTLELLRKEMSSKTKKAEGILESWSDEGKWQIAFQGQNLLKKKVTDPSGSSGTVMLATPSNAVQVTALIPQELEGLKDDLIILTYSEEDGGYEVEQVPVEHLTSSRIQMDLPVNCSYVMLVPVFYSVTFKDYNGDVLKVDKVKAGEAAVPPDYMPEREGYLFTGWSKDYKNVTENLTVTAKYSLISNEEKLISRLEMILEELRELEDQGPIDNSEAVKPLINQINGIDFADYIENQEVLEYLLDIEEEICDILGILPARTVTQSNKVKDAVVNGTVFGLEGSEGYLKIKDTELPFRKLAGIKKLVNAFALDVKLFSDKNKVHQVKGLLQFSFELPDNLELDESLVVIHYTGKSDEGQIIPYKIDGRRMTLVTDHLSTFTIANIADGDSDNSNSDSESEEDYGIRSVLSGKWKQNEKGWWYEFLDGSYPVGTWKNISDHKEETWYFFDEQGYMKTGWFTDADGSIYYLEITKDHTEGQMVTGWKLIEDKWYYFNTLSDGKKGAMFVNRRTPDGYMVGADGAWIKE